MPSKEDGRGLGDELFARIIFQVVQPAFGGKQAMYLCFSFTYKYLKLEEESASNALKMLQVLCSVLSRCAVEQTVAGEVAEWDLVI